jgi:tetratricopeptide (TPR) repeat protein
VVRSCIAGNTSREGNEIETKNDSNDKNNVYNFNEYEKITENVYKFRGFNANIDNIYVMYDIACQYKNSGDNIKALEMFNLCKDKLKDIDSIKIKYELYINLGLIHTYLNNSYEIILDCYENAMHICKERSEPYFYLGLYCNQRKKYDKAYELLTYAISNLSYNNVINKYENVQYNAYGKFLYDELAVSCYWLGKYEESIKYIKLIIDDPDFESSKDRLISNMNFAINKMNK